MPADRGPCGADRFSFGAEVATFRKPVSSQRHELELNRVPIVFDMERGSLSFFGLSSALFWTDPSLLKLLQPLVEEIGPDLFRMLVAHSSSHGTDEDYHQMVTSLGDSFEEGFSAWGSAVSVAGWGRFELPVFDAEDKKATVVVHNPWELEMQRNLETDGQWGCPFLMGKIIGIFTHALGTNCWANESLHFDAESNRVSFSVYPSDRTIAQELAELRRVRMRERERVLTEQVDEKTVELRAAQRRLERYSEELEQRVDERTHELRQAQSQLVQSERIAVLGQLVAGVAHEINNPLGAIKASASSVQEVLEEFPRDWIRLQQWCSDPVEYELATECMLEVNRPREFLDFRERRKLKAMHRATLEEHGVGDAAAFADELVHLGIHEDAARWVPLLRHPHCDDIMSVIGRYATMSAGVSDISGAVLRASKIVFSLSRYAHQDARGKPTCDRIQDGLETVLTLYHHLLKHGVQVECDFEDLPPLLGFHDELNQVWTNLIQNAVHAMSGAGRLRLSLRALEEHQVFEIEDSGSGLPDDIKERIFEPFFTTKPAGEGTGLGLSISSEIVSRHGGTLEVNSTLGKGTTFTISLPTAYIQEASP